MFMELLKYLRIQQDSETHSFEEILLCIFHKDSEHMGIPWWCKWLGLDGFTAKAWGSSLIREQNPTSHAVQPKTNKKIVNIVSSGGRFLPL